MTRVEKYREYRNEILNMKFETFSQKRQASKQIEKIHDSELGSKLNYEQVINVHDVYGNSDEIKKNTKRMLLTKYEIFYYLIALSFIAVMIVALIFVGIKQWR